MTTVAVFLLARIAEDEARLIRAQRTDATVLAAYSGAESNEMLTYVEEFDVGRALGECEAKRRIVDLHPLPYVADVCGTCSGPGVEWWPCPTLRALALPYADHPDFDGSWAI